MRALLILMALYPTLAHAGKVTRTTPRVEVFKNQDCQKTDSCDLVNFKFKTYEYKSYFDHGGINHGSGMYASFETKDLNTIEDYSVVQFIKGCKFASWKTKDGVQKKIKEKRDFFGEYYPWIHKEWVLDSVDTDPVYNSHPQGRHLVYRWNTSKNVMANHKKVYQQYPTIPFLFVRDFPGTAFIEDGIAKNISLKFKTCLYKSNTLPRVTGPTDVDPADALVCYDWDSSFIYNFDKKHYESKKDIDPFCL